jgi:hypothetical protein
MNSLKRYDLIWPRLELVFKSLRSLMFVFDYATTGWSASKRAQLKGVLTSGRPFDGPERNREGEKVGLHEALLYGRIAIHECEGLQFRRRNKHDYPERIIVRVQRAAGHKNNSFGHKPLEVAEVLTDDRHLRVGGAFGQHGNSDGSYAVKELLHQSIWIRCVSIMKQTIRPQFESCRFNMQCLKLKK